LKGEAQFINKFGPGVGNRSNIVKMALNDTITSDAAQEEKVEEEEKDFT
jgi:hypothetical protein